MATIDPKRAPRLSVSQYDRMIEDEAIGESDDVELIDGLIVRKATRSRPHVHAGRLGLATLWKIVPDGWQVAKEDPIVASDWSKPEPDLALVRGRITDYSTRHVTSKDVGLVVEIAASSLAVDRDVMGRLYAAGGIPNYWIVNLVDGLVEAYGDPDPTQGYRSRFEYRRGDSIPVPSTAARSAPWPSTTCCPPPNHPNEVIGPAGGIRAISGLARRPPRSTVRAGPAPSSSRRGR